MHLNANVGYSQLKRKKQTSLEKTTDVSGSIWMRLYAKV